MGAPIKNEVGNTYGKLEVLSHVGNGIFVCRCSCGKEKKIKGCELRRGVHKSCSCSRWKKHGMSKTRFYNIWLGMKKRCLNPKEISYSYCGARGIGVCKRWMKFENFKYDMFTAYVLHAARHTEINTTIDRINNRLGYSKRNCRWSTYRKQMRNKTDNIKIKYNGKEYILTDLAKRHGMNFSTLRYRLKKGTSIRESLSRTDGRTARWKI